MTTPYVTPTVFRNFPSGLDLTTVPFPGATTDQQVAELFNLCNRATAEAVGILQQEVRSTVNTEQEAAPSLRVGLNRQGIAEFRADRWPILRVLGGQVAPAAGFPRQWTVIPANQFDLKYSVANEYGTVAPDAAAMGPDTILIGPGYVTWLAGPGGYVVQVQYLNGWPHAGLTVNATAGQTQVTVDDTTGWVGVTGTVYDGASTETVFVTAATTASGPGVLTLSTALLYDHTIPPDDHTLLLSSMPADIQTATCYLVMEQVLLRGTTAVTIPSLPGAETHTGRDAGDLHDQACRILAPYTRTSW